MFIVIVNQFFCYFQAQDEHGETSFIRVDDPSASWLTMLRPAPSESVRNASVLYKGKFIKNNALRRRVFFLILISKLPSKITTSLSMVSLV